MYGYYCNIHALPYFLFNDTATTEIYTYLHTVSLHDALPISTRGEIGERPRAGTVAAGGEAMAQQRGFSIRRQARGEIGLVHQCHGAGMIEDIGDLRRLQPGAERHGDGAKPQGRQQRDDE